MSPFLRPEYNVEFLVKDNTVTKTHPQKLYNVILSDLCNLIKKILHKISCHSHVNSTGTTDEKKIIRTIMMHVH